MDSISPIVITSNAADKDLNKIRAQHADLVQGIQSQSERVANFNMQRDQQKQVQDQQNQAHQLETQKVQMDSTAKQMEALNKQKELDIKAQALAM